MLAEKTSFANTTGRMKSDPSRRISACRREGSRRSLWSEPLQRAGLVRISISSAREPPCPIKFAEEQRAARLCNVLEIERDGSAVRVHTRCQETLDGDWGGWDEWPDPKGGDERDDIARLAQISDAVSRRRHQSECRS